MPDETMSASRGAALTLEKIRFRYPGADTQMAFDLHVGAGRIVALMGPSGSGKSTLLNLVAGFEMPDEGRIVIGTADVTAWPPHRRPLSMVFQENNLFAHLTIFANVGLGRSAGLHLKDADRQDIRIALQQVGLEGRENDLPDALSGGERQRVALARTLVRHRPLLLLDEPLASLGPALKDDMLDLIRRLHTRWGMTVLMVTHDPRDAAQLSQDIVFLESGRISAQGATEEFFSPQAPEPFRAYLGRREI